MYVRVLHALMGSKRAGYEQLFGNPDVDASVRERSEVWCTAMSKACAYSAVMPGGSNESRRIKLRRCVCVTTCYCSRECQRKDWPSHRPRCRSICTTMNKATEQDISALDISPLDLRFHILYTRALARKNFSHLNLSVIPKTEGWQLFDYCLYIDLRQTPPKPALDQGMRHPIGPHDTPEEPHALRALDAPLSLLLDGYVPSDCEE
ncbi:hypothetical protein BD626DRAFT_511691 [Schizophyllum amplum]|uniref:MYND-type domain-containing protein n=1 Tax=Schizophyllum amplum TaxID=97359 RepID=A0A550C0R8_9AGAR|nr:hypothetical protein BD626DRAFT_511691 [Auriculariopsis ampla]